MSKSWRMLELARSCLRDMGFEVDVLDLSRQTSEFGKQIHPCKSASQPRWRSATGPATAIRNIRSGRLRALGAAVELARTEHLEDPGKGLSDPQPKWRDLLFSGSSRPIRAVEPFALFNTNWPLLPVALLSQLFLELIQSVWKILQRAKRLEPK